MTRELEAQYAAMIATAPDDPTIRELVRQIREDKRLDNAERNRLWSQTSRRHEDLPLEIRTSHPVTNPEDKAIVREVAAELQQLVVPIATPAQARAAWDAYVAMAQALEDPADVVQIEGKRFRKKSFWRKIALAYGVDVELREAIQELKDDKLGPYWSSTVLVRATTKTGRRADGVASCSNREPNKTSATAHVIYATAYTRAANRAIADLVAAGEVSAEEVE